MEEGRNIFKILTGKPTAPQGRLRRRWKVNIRNNLKQKGMNMRNWEILLAQLGLMGF